MDSKDKLILVAYVNIGNIHPEDVNQFLGSASEALKKGIDDTVTLYILPVKHGENRLECINPKLVSEEEYEKARLVCEELQDMLTGMKNENKKE